MEDHIEQNAPPSGMPENLLSNPELLRRVSEILGNVPSAEAQPTNASPMPSAAGDNLAAVLQDPAFLQKLPQMMELLRPMMGASPQGKPPVSAVPDTVKQRNELLRALKPFLSPSRAAAVDTIIRLSYLGRLPGLLS